MDVRDEESCRKTSEFVKSVTEGLWGVVCNAGVLGHPVIDDWQSTEKYGDVLSVNLVGTIRTVQQFRPLLFKSRGRIVFISSMLGKFGAPSLGPYCVSKFGMEGYANVIRHEYRMMGVTVHIVAPGFFTTNLNNTRGIYDLTEKAWREASDEARYMYGERYKERLKATMVEGLRPLAAQGTENVVNTCIHALTARYPKARYTLGLDGHFFTYLALLPVVFQDLFIDLWYAISGAPIPRYVLEDMPGFQPGILEQRRLAKQEETWKRLSMANGHSH